MSNRFGQLDRVIDGSHFARFDLDLALLLAVGTVDPTKFLECDFVSPLFLDRPAEALSESVGGQFDLVKIRNAIASL